MNAMLVLIGAVLYRWRGADHKYKKFFPRPFNQILFALPYAVVTYLFFGGVIGLLIGASVWAFATLATLTGHGRFMTLSEPLSGEEETLEFIIKPLQQKMPVYWYKVLGLSLTGLAITLPAGILTLNPFLALSGGLKGIAYAAAQELNSGTEGGELLTGAVLWGTL